MGYQSDRELAWALSKVQDLLKFVTLEFRTANASKFELNQALGVKEGMKM